MPDAPLNLHIAHDSVTTGSFVATWGAPLDDGGDPVREYEIAYTMWTAVDGECGGACRESEVWRLNWCVFMVMLPLPYLISWTPRLGHCRSAHEAHGHTGAVAHGRPSSTWHPVLEPVGTGTQRPRARRLE